MIIPAILENSLQEIQQKIDLVQKEASLIQIDMADGILTSKQNFTNIYSLDQLETSADLEVHLMVKKPLDFLFRKVERVKKICAQLEGEKAYAFITSAKNLGYETGISLNPDTPYQKIANYIEAIDYIQFLAVTPGRQGQDFQEKVLNKIVEFKNKYPNIRIQVDGGVKKQHIPDLLNKGVNDVVMGSYILESDNPNQTIKNLKETYE